MTTRRLVVVDLETAGLAADAAVVEVAWQCLDTDAAGVFIPAHDVASVLEHGHPDALAMNGYRERLATAAQDVDGSALRDLHHALRGQCLAGANPRFDAAHLTRLFRLGGLHPEPWHHRLCDIESYAAGVLGLDPADLPGLSRLCGLLGVTPGDHTAAADVAATAACFTALFAKAGVRIPDEITETET